MTAQNQWEKRHFRGEFWDKDLGFNLSVCETGRLWARAVSGLQLQEVGEEEGRTTEQNGICW